MPSGCDFGATQDFEGAVRERGGTGAAARERQDDEIYLGILGVFDTRRVLIPAVG